QGLLWAHHTKSLLDPSSCCEQGQLFFACHQKASWEKDAPPLASQIPSVWQSLAWQFRLRCSQNALAMDKPDCQIQSSSQIRRHLETRKLLFYECEINPLQK